MTKKLLSLFLLLFLSYASITVYGIPSESQSVDREKDFRELKLFLNPREKEWIENHRNITLAVNGNYMPYEGFLNTGGNNRVFEGIVSDYVRYINRRTGLDMHPKDNAPSAQPREMLRNREVDVIPAISYSPEREKFMLFTQPYLKLKLAVVVSNSSNIESPDDIRGKTIAAVGHQTYEEILKKDFPNSKFIHKKSIDAALKAVASGKIDAYIGDFSSIIYRRNRLGLDNLKLVGATPYEVDLRFGIRKDWPELVRIIEKTLATMTERQRHYIYRYWTETRIERETDWSIIFEIAGIGLAVVLVLCAFFILWNRRLGREIIDRKSIESELRNSVELLETLFDTIPGPVFYIGIEGEFLGCNKAFCDEISGGTKSDLKKRNIYDVFAIMNSDKITAMKSNTSQLIQNPGVQVFDIDLVCTDGTIRDFSVYSATFRRNHRQSGIICLMLDITDKKKIDKELILAKNAAEVATDAKSNFVANMSHELRTPLNAVIGISHLIMQTELNEKQLNYLHKIDSASRHLLGVINDILDFSKIEAGKMNMEIIDFSVKKVCQDISDMFVNKAREKDLKLTFSVSPRIPRRLKGDPLRLKQILINLVSNAIKFTNSGEVVLMVDAGRRRGRKIKVKFTVQDTGIGMSQEQVESLFVPFTQADESMTRKFGGTGLGLVITKSLIELMSGRLEVESSLDIGSTFAFDIELESDPDAEDATDTSTVIPLTRVSMKSKHLEKLEKIRGAQVLLVEDNAINRQVAMEMLTQAGIVVEVAENGQEAVDMIVDQNMKFDAVFMDVQMPIMDGYKATELIRENTKELPIIALTAHVMPAAIKRCLQSGMNDHLNKPLNPELLYSTLVKWVKPGKREFTPPQQTTKPAGKPELCDMPGLNITSALEPIDGDTVLMKQLLDTFRKDFGHEGLAMMKRLQEGKLDDLKNSLHKIKGSASYIGADDIKTTAAVLEEKLINGETVSIEELNVLAGHISTAVDSIAILIEKPTIVH